jgi:hypothetical protein
MIMSLDDDDDGKIRCSHFVDFDDGDTDWIDLDDAEKAGHLRWPSKDLGLRNKTIETRNHKKRRISCSSHQSNVHPNTSETSEEDSSPKKHRKVSLEEACDQFSSISSYSNEPHNDNNSGDSLSACPLLDSCPSQPLRVISVKRVTSQNTDSENKYVMTPGTSRSESSLDIFHPVSPNSRESHGDDTSSASSAAVSTPGLRSPIIPQYSCPSQPLRVVSVQPQATSQNTVSENNDATNGTIHSTSSLDSFHPVSPNSSESHGDDSSASPAACTPGFSTSVIPQLQDGKDSVEPPQPEISYQASTAVVDNVVKPENTKVPSFLEAYELMLLNKASNCESVEDTEDENNDSTSDNAGLVELGFCRSVVHPGSSIVVDISLQKVSANNEHVAHGNVVTPEKAGVPSSLVEANDSVSPNNSSVSESQEGAEDPCGQHYSAPPAVRAIDFRNSMPSGMNALSATSQNDTSGPAARRGASADDAMHPRNIVTPEKPRASSNQATADAPVTPTIRGKVLPNSYSVGKRHVVEAAPGKNWACEQHYHPFPPSIDSIIRYMDRWEPGQNYFLRQQDSRQGEQY